MESIRIEHMQCHGRNGEQRATCRAFYAWLERHRDGGLPSSSEVLPSMGAELSDLQFIVSLDGDRGRLVVDRCGPRIVDLCAIDPVDRECSAAFPSWLGGVVVPLARTVEVFATPKSHSGTAHTTAGEIRFRILLLPLSIDGESVDSVLGTLSFRRLS